MENVLKTTGLTKIYGHRKVVNDVSLTLNRGEIYGLIGRNGAGKTTFMRLVLGLAIPDSGTIELFGGEDPHTAGQKTGSIIEAPALYGNCSAFENLKLFSILSERRTSLAKASDGAGFTTGSSVQSGHDDDRRLKDLIDIVGLTDAGNKKVGHYSLGMKQRLGLAVAMLGDPELMILDEPVNGLDPAGIKDIRDTIIRLNSERGVSFLISSHLLDELSKIATKYGIINNGFLVDEITTAELADRCRRPLLITVDDPARAVNILSSRISPDDIRTEGNTLSVFNHSADAADINTLLVSSGLAVSGLSAEHFSIEDYFIERMGA